MVTHGRRFAFALLLLLLLLAGCSSQEPAPAASPAATAAPATSGPAEESPAAEGSAPAAQVLVGLFSGRPNPSWTLSEEQSAQLMAALGALEATAEGAPPPERLGYTGFQVSLIEETGEQWSLQAYDGLVRRERAGAVDFLADPQRSVERMLLGSGGGQLEPAVLELIEQAIGQLPDQ